MRIVRDLVLPCASLLFVACGDGGAAPDPVVPPISPESPSATAPSVPTPVAPPDAPSAPSIARADVDALLASWLDAQNRGDFDAYAALYATRFEGVRRTERSTFRLDHDAWMEDRRRLFGRPMQVSAADVEVVSTPTMAVVRFTQGWSSGRYAEEGPKRMVVVREGGALRISSEEMIAARAVPAVSGAAGTVFPAFDTAQSTFIVLGEATDSGVGAPRDVAADAMRIALRDAGPALPPALAALSGQPVQLVGETGVCAATVTSLGVAAFVRPHFGTEQAWADEDFDDTTTPVPMPRAQVALEVDAMAERHYWVAITARSTCGHARAAVPGTRAPIVWPRVTPPGSSSEVLALLLTPNTRRELLDELRAGRETTGEPALDDAALEAELRSSAQISEFGPDPRTSVLEARFPIPGECGGSVRVFAFTRTAGVLARRDDLTWRSLLGAIDVEGDGAPELLVTDDFGNTQRIVHLGATPTTLGEWSFSDFDCGC